MKKITFYRNGKELNLLDTEMQENDAGAKTIRDYLRLLLLELWEEQEAFSAKRPFGNSGWDYELYIPLIEAGVVEGELDEYGYILEVEEDKAFNIIKKLIEEIWNEPSA